MPRAAADNQASTLLAHTKPGAVADNQASTLLAHTKPGAVADNQASTLLPHTKPGAVADNKASTLPAHTKPGAVADNKASTLPAHTKPGAVADNKASTLPAHTKPGAVADNKASTLPAHTKPGAGSPHPQPALALYDDGGRSSTVAATGPPAILDTVTGSYYQDPQGHIPHASTHREAPSGYHPQQPLPGQSQRGTASPYHGNLHPGYSAISPASLPPMSTISGEAESFRRHAYDDSSLHSGHHHDFVEKDSPPSSNISSQSAQPPDASQQMLQYSRRGGSQQPQQQQAPYKVTAGAGSSQVGPLPSRFAPPGGYAHSANVRHPVQETQQGPSGKTQPSSQAAYTSPNTSQPGGGMDPDGLDVGIEREIYHTAKKSDSEAPQTY